MDGAIEVVKDVGTALRVDVQDSDIAAAHRVPSYKKDREPSLIVQFNNRAVRDLWISKYRTIKNLSAQNINKEFPARRVFINDHLSPENKQFLTRIKQKCRDIGYTFAWSRDGKFFVRKGEGDRIQRIDSYADIEKLK
ncbi:hypothetical protein J6590_083537 [Homalodisca vitripennis]|nr:hypothetical protein J6590_083537 [Homalodisca vitripennis]